MMGQVGLVVMTAVMELQLPYRWLVIRDQLSNYYSLKKDSDSEMCHPRCVKINRYRYSVNNTTNISNDVY